MRRHAAENPNAEPIPDEPPDWYSDTHTRSASAPPSLPPVPRRSPSPLGEPKPKRPRTQDPPPDRLYGRRRITPHTGAKALLGSVTRPARFASPVSHARARAGVANSASPLRLFVDSGCTFHVHNDVRDLVNIRNSVETIWDAGGTERRVTAIGDMPILAKASNGKVFGMTIKDVRIVEGFLYSLLSVDQLWANSKVDTVFRDVRSIIAPATAPDAPPKAFPFLRQKTRRSNGTCSAQHGSQTRSPSTT